MKTLIIVMAIIQAAANISAAIAFLYYWRLRMRMIDAKVNFLYEQENERFLKSIGRSPKRYPNAPDTLYAQKVLSGEIDPKKVSLLDFYTKAEFIVTPNEKP